MKTEVKLGLAAVAVLLAILVGAYVLVPAPTDNAARSAGSESLLNPAKASDRSGDKPSDPLASLTPPASSANSAPATQPAALDTLTPPLTPLTTPSPTAGGALTATPASTQPSTPTASISVGGSPIPPATQPSATSTPGGSTPAGGTTASGPTDWNALLAGAAGSSNNATSSGGNLFSPGSSSTSTGNLPPSVGPRADATPGSGFRPITPPLSSPSSGPSGASAGSDTTYVVARGDTLSSISTKVYGNPNLWSKIAQANPGVNSSRLKIGQTLKIPHRDEAAPAAEAAPVRESVSGSSLAADPKSEYVVRSGDSLHKIAAKLYGNANRWEDIYNLNKATIGPSPTKLKIGQVLKLPAPPTASSTPSSSTPASSTPPSTRP